ncbi:polysaccharide biosynthesis protein GtrA [Paenibacillus elgii]|uniref:Polysaccharide biosynthesis protein GtrA n=1 Tax=Paenibacillus elgii TaxID=189691 RepID=A0A2T6G6W1_9BACL|nr:GtrA family protein [Paenibacillus elgii]PUA39894.1 polysaccharide biosynthesis protein GtrA [Paenibacillus elgii]
MIRKLYNNELIRFLFVGGLNTAFGYSIFALFIFVGLHYTLASLFSTILGILFNFKSTGILVFNSKKNSLIYKFIAVYGIVYLINVSLLKILSLFITNVYFSGAIILLPLAVLSYILNKKFVFKVDL